MLCLIFYPPIPVSEIAKHRMWKPVPMIATHLWRLFDAVKLQLVGLHILNNNIFSACHKYSCLPQRYHTFAKKFMT